ncbi:MAG: DUF4956 domain-containing protein [Firmicutes bacterium]|nr:DUF4956 domain-containing protein [Bacillota bacterium]
MGFEELFRNEFFIKATGFSPISTLITIGVAFCVGLYIYFIYKKSYSGALYSSTFGVALLTITLISTFLVLALNNSLVVSLSMIGALSIVRFRASVRQPLDIAFIFWALSAGIVLGVGLILLAVLGSIFIGIILMVFDRKHVVGASYTVLVRCVDEISENSATEYIKKISIRYSFKSKVMSPYGIELICDIRLKTPDTSFVNELYKMNGIYYVIVSGYDGSYSSS